MATQRGSRKNSGTKGTKGTRGGRRSVTSGPEQQSGQETAGPKRIDCALQGGGAHGAFAWGVLDRLLADGRIAFDGISGTSAGAMNAVAVADGWTSGGAEGARESLHRFWSGVSEAARFSPLQRTPLDFFLGRWSLDASPVYILLDHLSRALSPYEWNPLDLNPLRDLVAELIDFERVNCCADIKVFLTATNVRTGRPRVFRQPELSADAVMASACLPFLYKAVEIDGEAYWDGGYMGNPALFPLVDECDARDLILVQINPFHRDELPRSGRDIFNRLNEITFNASLIKELRAIALLKQLIDSEGLERERYRDMLFHVVQAEEALADLKVSSKMNAEWAFLSHLHDIGWETAEAWLADNFDAIGKRSTFDLDSIFCETLRPVGVGDDEA